MDKMDKQARKELREVMKAQGGQLFSIPTSGVTVLIVPSAGEGSDYARVSVAMCDFKDDEFKRKRGELITLERMFVLGQSIPVLVNFRTFDEIAQSTVEMMVG